MTLDEAIEKIILARSEVDQEWERARMAGESFPNIGEGYVQVVDAAFFLVAYLAQGLKRDEPIELFRTTAELAASKPTK